MNMIITVEKGPGQYFIAYINDPTPAFSIGESAEQAVKDLVSGNKNLFDWKNVWPEVLIIKSLPEASERVKRLYQKWDDINKCSDIAEALIWKIALGQIMYHDGARYDNMLHNLVRAGGHYCGLKKKLAFHIFNKVWLEINGVIDLINEEFKKQ